MATSQLKGAIDLVLGRPFEWLGRGPDAFDCLGLWLHLLHVELQVWIAHPFRAHADGGSETELLAFWRRFEEIPLDDAELPLDLFFWRPGGRPHVATVQDSWWTASVDHQSGVHRLPWLIARGKAEKAYRLLGDW